MGRSLGRSRSIHFVSHIWRVSKDPGGGTVAQEPTRKEACSVFVTWN